MVLTYIDQISRLLIFIYCLQTDTFSSCSCRDRGRSYSDVLDTPSSAWLVSMP